jgi:holliday junction DNA helicase RuvA
MLPRMYECVRGRLLEKEPTRCVIEAAGFGYVIAVPISTFEKLPRVGEEASLRLHLVVPERGGEWRLFGFSTVEERALFRRILTVAGVGPATALALLSGMSAHDLRTAVVQGDVRALTRVKGVGKKTAERLVVELKDVLGSGSDAGPGGPPVSGTMADACAALVALGLDAAEADERLRRIPGATGLPVPELVRRALRTG